MTKPKKIVIDCERMKYPNTGLYHFCKELGYALIRQSASFNDDLTFYLNKNQDSFFGKDQQYIIQKPYHKLLSAPLAKCDIWHCTFQGSQYLPTQKRGLKIVSTIHDLNFIHENKPPHKISKYLKQIEELIKKSDCIATISEFVKKDILNNIDIGNKQIKVIYNGCNKPQTDTFQQPNIMSANRPFFFTIGTITDKKNFHVLPAMLIGNDFDLVIAGITNSETYKNKIIVQAQKLGVSNRVKFLGAISQSEKYWLMQHCQAFCFPSIAEGFGLPVIEAMQFGTQVILSKATSLPEIGGPYALYFDSFEAESVAATAHRFISLAEKNIHREDIVKWATKFDWNQTALAYWKIYQSL